VVISSTSYRSWLGHRIRREGDGSVAGPSQSQGSRAARDRCRGGAAAWCYQSSDSRDDAESPLPLALMVLTDRRRTVW